METLHICHRISYAYQAGRAFPTKLVVQCLSLELIHLQNINGGWHIFAAERHREGFKSFI
jgi:hypothetical protein